MNLQQVRLVYETQFNYQRKHFSSFPHDKMKTCEVSVRFLSASASQTME